MVLWLKFSRQKYMKSLFTGNVNNTTTILKNPSFLEKKLTGEMTGDGPLSFFKNPPGLR